MSPLKIYMIAGPDREELPVPDVMAPAIEKINGALVGVITDPPSLSDLPRGPKRWSDLNVELHHVATLQKSLVHEPLPQVTHLQPTEMQRVSEELATATYGTGEITVDGQAVQVDTLTYRGLDFAFGREVWNHPFAVFRSAGDSISWPDLLSVDVPDND